jgi:hypothetical protein
MKYWRFTLVGAFVLAVVVAGLSDLAYAQFTFSGKARGHCQLKNVQVGRVIYDGICTIKQKVSGASTVFEIKLGSAQPFLFATADGGQTWMTGPTRVRYRDLGHTGIFRWDAFRLEVSEEF